MKGFVVNIEEEALENADFRRVLYTSGRAQLVLMSLPAGSEIGMETHPDNDQFFRIESGAGMVVIDDNEYTVTDGSAVVVPAGAQHNVINTSSSEPLQLYTIYSPPHHKDGTVHATKVDADGSDEEFDGVTTE